MDSHLRWHPSLRHPCGHIGPALVGLVTNTVTISAMSLHKTWLAADGSGKAAIERPRMLLAGHRKCGGVIRLWPDDSVTCGLTVAEGIETALTAARGFTPVWATIDAGNLSAFPILPGVECLTVCVDYDPAGLRAWASVSQRWTEAGREVRHWISEHPGDDLNDLYRDEPDV